MQHNGWDHALKVTADGAGLVGHAGRGPAPQGRRPGGTDRAAQRGAAEEGHVARLRPGHRAGLAGGRDRARGHQHERHRAAGAPGPRARGRAERADGAAGPGPGRDAGHAGPDRTRPGESPRARVEADRGHARRVPVAGRRGEAPDGLAGDRHGRHRGHRQLFCDKEGAAPTWKKGYGFHPLARLARQHPRVPGDAAAPGQRRANTFTDHREVLAAAMRQVPARSPGGRSWSASTAPAPATTSSSHLLHADLPAPDRCCSPAGG